MTFTCNAGSTSSAYHLVVVVLFAIMCFSLTSRTTDNTVNQTPLLVDSGHSRRFWITTSMYRSYYHPITLNPPLLEPLATP